MLEGLRRNLEYLNRRVDRGRTTRELTRCAVINGGTFGVSIATTLGLLIYGDVPSALIFTSFGVSCLTATMSNYQLAEAHFMRINRV